MKVKELAEKLDRLRAAREDLEQAKSMLNHMRALPSLYSEEEVARQLGVVLESQTWVHALEEQDISA